MPDIYSDCMKIRLYFPLVLMLAVMFIITSCSDTPGKKLLGKWQGSEATLKSGDSLFLNSATFREGVNAHKHTFYTFKRDNTFTRSTDYKQTHRNISGTWTMGKDGKDLTMVIPENSSTNVVKLVELSSQKLVWITNYPFGELSTTFIKVR